jgi:hypothetical protein
MMAARICFGRYEATLDDNMVWHCDNAHQQALLRELKQTWDLDGHPYTPNEWVTHAEYVADEMGGRVLAVDTVVRDMDTVY